jgi:hypothetical protein
VYTKQNLNTHLVTKAQYDLLAPCDQGFICYLQAELPGSELKDFQTNPYEKGSLNAAAWERGQRQGVLLAQDSED